jgi:hypothetical protein
MQKMKKEMQIDAELSISKTHSGTDGDLICIRIEDVDAGVVFVEARVDLLSMMQALTGLMNRPCKASVHKLDQCWKTVGNKDSIHSPS